MGCDIHCYAERKVGKKYQKIKLDVLGDRSYGTFGFLANVRNYSDIPPIAERRGFPADASNNVRAAYEGRGSDAHSPSWLTLDELMAFDYEQPVEDRRVTRQTAWGLDGGCTSEPGGGQMTTFRDFLGYWFFKDLQKLREAGADRIVFWFDN